MKHISILVTLMLLPLAALPASEPLPKCPLLLANYYCWYHGLEPVLVLINDQ